MPCPAHYTESVLYCCKKRTAQKADQRWIRKMSISLSLLLLLGVPGAAQQGNFGIFTACLMKNANLRLECYYAPCTNSPSFNCKFMLKGEELGTASDTSCKTFEHSLSSTSEILNFTCILTRKKRSEEKQISIKGKESLKPCMDTTGLLLHQAPPLLWPVILSLCRILIEDS